MAMPDKNDHESQLVTLLTEHQLSLVLYIRSLMPGDPSARDVAQQTNVTLWQKRQEFEPGTNFKAWIFSIARFEVLNYRKLKSRDSKLVFSEEVEELISSELADLQLDSFDRLATIQNCFAKLRVQDRELILHCYSSNATLANYAQKTGRSEGGLKVTLHRLRNQLSACIKNQLTFQGGTS